MAQRQIPGGKFVNETATAQRQIPGSAFVNETAAAAGGVSAALTGQAITVAQGTVLPDVSTVLTGQAITVAQGTATESVGGTTAALTGQAITIAQGTVASVVSVALTGQAISVAQGTVAVAAATYGDVYNAAGYFTTGGTVTISLYDPITGAAISLSSNACPEIGTTGVYIWDTTKLTAQPSGYQEYAYKMSNGTTFSGGMITMAITAQAIATAVWAETLDVITAEQTMKVVLAALAGKRAGIGTATERYYDSAGTAAVVTFAPDARGNGIPTVTP